LGQPVILTAQQQIAQKYQADGDKLSTPSPQTSQQIVAATSLISLLFVMD
jgi:hypothetical protein